MSSAFVQLITVTCLFNTVFGMITVEDYVDEELVASLCTINYTLYDGRKMLCYTIVAAKQTQTGVSDHCKDRYGNDQVWEAKIPDREGFYQVFDIIKKRSEMADFASGSVKILIGLTYRRGDGFRWADGSAPNDLSFLKFNPIDNLNDDDGGQTGYCLRFTVKVDKTAQDGYQTNWYDCDGKYSLDSIGRPFYVLCSYINPDDLTRADITTCTMYSKEYAVETGRMNILSPAAVPSGNLLRVLQNKIVKVHRQFEKPTHGLLIGLMFAFHEYGWKDDISVVQRSLGELIAPGVNPDVDCYRFMIFRAFRHLLVPVKCDDKNITYDVICKYVLRKAPNITRIESLDEIKELIDREPEDEFLFAHGTKLSSDNQLITLFLPLFTIAWWIL